MNSTLLPVATTDLLLIAISPPHNDLLVPGRHTVQENFKLTGARLLLLKLFPELNPILSILGNVSNEGV